MLTVKLRSTLGAAFQLALPAWDARNVQVPAARSVTVVPLTVQIVVVWEAKETASPEVAVALTDIGVWSSRVVGGAVNVMVWLALAIVKLRSTLGAAL